MTAGASDRDFIAQLDAAIGCQQCEGPLGDSPSDDFCSAYCQSTWSAARAEALTSYQEPVDLAAHVGNQVELYSAETDPSGGGANWVAQVMAAHEREAHARCEARIRAASSPPSDAVVAAVFWYDAYRRRHVVGIAPERGTSDVVVRADIRQFRDALQRDLERMGHAAELPENWVTRFAGVTLTDWQGEVLRHHARRYQAQLGCTMAAFAPVAEQLRAAAQTAAEVGQAWVNAWNSSASPILPLDDLRQQPRSIDEVLQENRRERALQLRRNRNTGPSAASRAPRTINPRRGR